MGMPFFTGPRDVIRAKVLASCNEAYAPICTPNVDIVMRYINGTIPRKAIDEASLRICDSKILTLLASIRGKQLSCYPGSDLVADILHDRGLGDLQMAVVGPSPEDVVRLQARFPWQQLEHIPAADRLVPGTADWTACVEACAAADWDMLLICLGSPKQELLAEAIGTAGRGRGAALLVGASVDFLTGRQARAPKLMQRLMLEWLYRLLREPRRMWRRYLIENPGIFLHFLRLEVMPRAGRMRSPPDGGMNGWNS